MKTNPLLLITGLTLVTFIATIEIYIQPVDAQKIGDIISPTPSKMTIPSMDKIHVSIVSGATSLTDEAYTPNPIELIVGQTVIWTNNDFSFHTVTSGEAGSINSGSIFDSGLTGPTTLSSTGKTFEYTFESVGEFPYYCILHPGMVGKVIVDEL